MPHYYPPEHIKIIQRRRSNNHIAYLVEDKIDFDVFKTRPSVTDLIEDLPDDCKPLLNLSLAHLADKFPFDIAKMIWDFTSEKIDETPHERRAIAHMSDYLDGIFIFWLKKGFQCSLAIRLSLIFLCILSYVHRHFNIFFTTLIIMCIILAFVSVITFIRVKCMMKYFIQGHQQQKLWVDYKPLRLRSFCQLRGFITINTFGTFLYPLSTTAFCGQNESTQDSISTLTYAVPIFLIPFISLTAAYQIFASMLWTHYSDSFSVIEMAPSAFFPALVILVYHNIWETLRKGVINEKKYTNNVWFGITMNFTVLAFMALFRGTIFISFVLYFGALYQLGIYAHLAEVMGFALAATDYFFIETTYHEIVMAVIILALIAGDYYLYITHPRRERIVTTSV